MYFVNNYVCIINRVKFKNGKCTCLIKTLQVKLLSSALSNYFPFWLGLGLQICKLISNNTNSNFFNNITNNNTNDNNNNTYVTYLRK